MSKAPKKAVKPAEKEKPNASLTKKDSSTLVKKIAAVSDSTNTLSKEIKGMAKIFSENQKVLISIRDMIDTLASAIEQIQKQSKQINIIEEDSQRLFAGLNQVRSQASLVTKLHDQTSRLQDQVNKISQVQKESPSSESIMKSVSDNMASTQNNTHMIIKIAQRIDGIKENLDDISSKTEKISSVGTEIEDLKRKIQSIYDKSEKTNLESEILSLKQNLNDIAEKTESTSGIMAELESIKGQIMQVSDKAAQMDSFGDKIQGLQQELLSNMARTEAIKHLSGEVQKIESEINSLVKRADATAFVGEGLKSVQEDLAGFKDAVFNKTNTIDQKVSAISELFKRSDASASEFHKKADQLFQNMQEIRTITNKSSSNVSKEVIGLLKLSEFQSNLRILSESKYGELKDIERMAEQTASIVNLFDRISIESDEKLSLPQEVRQWAMSKMLDSADKWEIRFTDLFAVLIDKLGKELVKENIRIQQVRDIFGIRGVDEIRKELDLV
ncbi:chemotaxis protein [Candidatus Nitrosotenuis sp. DW1]|uniref:chemotaxis protein n=1 Tax=Candidatus Nitrosotenuis sp. DW1 TaxID=2259672 RepID=UPI0015CE4A60|nr:chemotaxis protein [Candidatus Nitrosotenuis sp. DW1]QLH08472.1 chemotaxis protein [Candidatus Nitrosotenuis sp. DW1]